MITKEEWNKVALQLTISEASELRDSLNVLLSDRNLMRHEHVESDDFEKEITVFLAGE